MARNVIFSLERVCAIVVKVIFRTDLKLIIFSTLYMRKKWQISCMFVKKYTKNLSEFNIRRHIVLVKTKLKNKKEDIFYFHVSNTPTLCSLRVYYSIFRKGFVI